MNLAILVLRITMPMQPHPHLIRLYNRTIRRYRKLTARLGKHDDPSSFSYRTLVAQLRKLRRRLAELHGQLKVAVAAGVVVMTLSTGTAQAQTNPGPFVRQGRETNPLREPFRFQGNVFPAPIDLDNDGDYDLVVGHTGLSYRYDVRTQEPLAYLINIGTPEKPWFEAAPENENPFAGLAIDYTHRAPVFADLDEDGDDDLIVGTEETILYFRNDGGTFNPQTGTWNPEDGSGNPFSGLSIYGMILPTFTDFDNDGDLDAFVAGNNYDPSGQLRKITYLRNDGKGKFVDATDQLSFSPAVTWEGVLAPAVADADGDGDLDIILGAYYNGLLFYQQVTPGEFVLSEGEWDPASKSGNPFDGVHSGGGWYVNTNPSFADLDKDGDLDLLLGGGNGYWYSYAQNTIMYFLNEDNGVFKRQRRLANSLEGVFVRANASPTFADIDNDGDLDAVIGHKYDGFRGQNVVEYYRRDEEGYQFIETENSPFKGTGLFNAITPAFGDVDGDGDLDLLIGRSYGEMVYFINDNGVYKDPGEGNNPFSEISGGRTSPEFADLDGDGDLDLILTDSYSGIRYFENVGDAQNPDFVVSENNPFAGFDQSYYFLTLSDIDHDGDLDLVLSEYTGYDYSGYQISYYENIGGPYQPSFAKSNTQPFITNWDYSEAWDLQPAMVDYDGDGDLDLFVGTYAGTIALLRNENPAPVITMASDPLEYRVGIDESILVDPDLTVADQDGDMLIRARVSIRNFEYGDRLSVINTRQISATYNSETGVLTLEGVAPADFYQSVLQTLTYQRETQAAGRQREGERITVTKFVDVQIFDTDLTTGPDVARELHVITNTPPVFESTAVTVSVGGSIVVKLADLVSDPDGDQDFTTLDIVEPPASGAVASINDNHELVVDYAGLPFIGTETLAVQVCDSFGECAQATVTIEVVNTPPVIAAETLEGPAGNIQTLNLLDITSDADDNLNPQAFSIVTQPISGAIASIEVVSPEVVNLVINYEGIAFNGIDEMRIRSCDHAGACTEQLLRISVETSTDVVVYNAVAPNSAGDNKFMRIANLPSQNRVSIYNRWGDLVFEMENYDDKVPGKRFEGVNNNGSTLASGTYFYRIETSTTGGKREVSGFIVLKQ